MSKYIDEFKGWYAGHKGLAHVLGVVILVWLFWHVIPFGSDKPVEPINTIRATEAAKPEVKVKTKKITKVVYPESCLEMTKLTKTLANTAKALAAAPDEARELIGDARVAVAESNNDAVVEAADKLSAISDLQNEQVDSIISTLRSLSKAEVKCQSAIK